ncbi:MAG: class I SAM-dependent methyltransferase [Actinomycetes bacterium]|jgi:SAM-dependent methyltransferase
MSSNVTIDSEGTVTGNTFDKYGSENPVVRRLMSRFHRDLDACYSLAAPTSILDIGCGEGVLTHEWAGRLGDGRIVGVDLDDPLLHAQWEQRKAPNLEYRVMKGERLDFADNEFDTSTAIEVLEHVTDPEMVLSEMARCAERWLIVSVPREPLWRITNMARGAYWGQLGNTPGHVNHWSSAAFTKLLSRYGSVVELRHPFPWIMSVVRIGG